MSRNGIGSAQKDNTWQNLGEQAKVKKVEKSGIANTHDDPSNTQRDYIALQQPRF